MPSTTPTRHPRDVRRPDPPVMRLTERDLAVLRALAAYRVLTLAQLTRLVFTGRDPSVAKRRLYLLYHHGYVTRQFLPVRGGLMTSPILYLLDRQGATLVAQTSADPAASKISVSGRVGGEFLAHTLAINEFRINVTLACHAHNMPLMKWVGERDLKAAYDWVFIGTGTAENRRVAVIPDSYFTLAVDPLKIGSTACFALELDRGTMALKRFKRKVQAYLTYVESGAYMARYGTKSLRVLTVTESAARLTHLRRVTEAAGGKTRFWFATLDQVTPEQVLTHPVWQVARRAEHAALLDDRAGKGVAFWQPLMHLFASASSP